MLLIQNIETIIDRVVLGEWWVENYELIGDNQYQFLISNIRTLKKFTIQVERLPIGEEKLIYEIWAWKEDGNIIRKMVDLKHFKQIDDFTKVLETMVLNYLND